MPEFPLGKHGTRGRYVAGCRCAECREANRLYYHKNIKDRIYGRNDPLVRATKTRNHLRKLQKAGIGRRTIHDISGVNENIIAGIRDGKRKKCRKSTQARILEVTEDAYGDAHLVDAEPTQKKLRELLDRGYTKIELARRLGSKAQVPALQLLKRKLVTARNAMKVEKLYKRLTEESTNQLTGWGGS